MKRKTRAAKKRDTKAEEKRKEEVENDTTHSILLEAASVNPTIEDFITCQIWKEAITKEHRMCPSWYVIWCHECIKPWFKSKITKWPNCRKSIKSNQLKKLPLFEKLKDLVVQPASVKIEPKGWEIHDQPDDFFCQDCQVLCWSKCALLTDNHKNHSFTSLEDIYKIKKEAIEKLKENLGDLNKYCQKLLTDSNSNIHKSEENLKKERELFQQRVKSWEDDFWNRFQKNLDFQHLSKTEIETLLMTIKDQRIKVNEILEHPHKNKLVKRYTGIVDTTNGVLGKKGNVKMAEIIQGEDIENHFIPSYTVQEWVLPPITNETKDDIYLYADVFKVVKDEFRLGAKIVKNKKLKTVNISLRISKPNQRAKQYEVLLFQKTDMKCLGEYILSLEKDSNAEHHILIKTTLNST